MLNLELDTFEKYLYFLVSLILVVMLTKLIMDFNRGFSNLEDQIREMLKEPTFERRSKRVNDPTKVQLSVQIKQFMNTNETFITEYELIEFIDNYIDKYCKPNYEKDTFTPDEKMSKLFRLPLNHTISYAESFYQYLPEHYKVLESDE
jgi:hypothetical protein